MAVKTSNIYGKIVISDRTIEKFVAHTALDCYGIVEFVPRNFFDAVACFLDSKNYTKGVKVSCSGDRIYIDIATIVKYGVSIKAVVESLKEMVRYKVERFSGMVVDTVNVYVLGVEQ